MEEWLPNTMSLRATSRAGGLKKGAGQEKGKDHSQQVCLLLLFLSTFDYALWETGTWAE